MAKNDNTIYWIIGIATFVIVAANLPLTPPFAIIDPAPDSQNLVYQIHDNIKLIEDGCLIEQRNYGSLGTSLSCSTWLSRNKGDGYIDMGVSEAPFFWHKDGTEWRWITGFRSSGTGCSIQYYRGGLWSYFADVKLIDGQLVREISDLYNYYDYNFAAPTKMSYIEYVDPEWIMDGYCPLGVTTNEEGIEIIDDCGSFGAVDPNPYDELDQLKCNAYCRAGEKECIERVDGLNESQYCKLDGTGIEHQICYSTCEGGICAVKPTVDIPYIGDLNYGDDVNITVRFLLGEEIYGATLIIGRIEVGGASISETSNYTDDNGYTTLRFKNVEAVGFASFITSVTVRGIIYEDSTEIFFSGIPVNFESTTYSYTQSNADNISFLVEVKDSKNRDIHPELIEDLRAETSLSEGIVFGNTIEYLGSGVYEVSSEVNGTGIFLGKILFTYQGQPFESPAIKIDVEYATISVGTSLIPPTATLDTEETLIVSFVSSLGTLLDPDGITIRVSWPSGFEEEILYLSDLRKVGNGTYEFDYLFTQVEKYSFDIVANKEGFATGNAKASVSVTGDGDYGPGPGFGFGNLELIFYAAIVLIVLFVVIGKGRKRL